MRMEIDVQTLENSKNISALTNTVTELATIVRITEEQYKNDRQDMREMVNGLKDLNQKIGSLTNVQEKLGELAAEVVKARHDVRNIENKMSIIVPIKDQQIKDGNSLVAHEGRINELEKWKDGSNLIDITASVKALNEWKIKTETRVDTVRVGIHIFWAVFGSALLGAGYWIAQGYFTHPNKAEFSYQGKVISGE